MQQPLPSGRFAIADPAPAARTANGIDMSTISARGGQRIQAPTRESAVEFVIDAIESTGAATRYDFDIDQIVTHVHALADDWDFTSLQRATFWRVASSFIKE